MNKIIFGMSVIFILQSCQSDHERKLVGNYIVYKYEKNDTINQSVNPQVSLKLNVNNTFKLVSNGIEDSGRWEANTLKEFDNISFFFDKKRNIECQANFDIKSYSTLIYILNPRDFFYPELHKLSLKKTDLP